MSAGPVWLLGSMTCCALASRNRTLQFTSEERSVLTAVCSVGIQTSEISRVRLKVAMVNRTQIVYGFAPPNGADGRSVLTARRSPWQAIGTV